MGYMGHTWGVPKARGLFWTVPARMTVVALGDVKGESPFFGMVTHRRVEWDLGVG